MALAAIGQLNLDDIPLGGCRSIDCFEKLEKIGQGTHGHVFMAKDMITGEIVALKKIVMENERYGFPITAVREIRILQQRNHQNVIRLKEIVTSPGPENDEQGRPAEGKKFKGSIYMVFEYMDHDLSGLSNRPGIQFSIPQIKCYMRQLLTGLHYCHVNHVLHRDLKGANLLIDNEGNLKLADFGLARVFSGGEDEILTNRVVTLWYRPPELLLGSRKYGPEVDMWSVGCIFTELLDGNPILPGQNQPDQLSKIFELCGTPDESNWPGVTKMPGYGIFKPPRPMKRRIREVFKHFDHFALDLLEKMLTLDPKNRISEKEALDADYFWTDPIACDPKSLPKYESSHELKTKKKHQQRRQQEEAAKQQMPSHQIPQIHSPPIHPLNLPPPPTRANPNQPMHGSQLPMAAGGPSHCYDEPPRPSGGPNWYQQGSSASGHFNPNPRDLGSIYSMYPYPFQGRGPPRDLGSIYNRYLYPFQGRGPPSYGGSDMSGAGGRSVGGYGVSGPNYPQGGWYGSSGPGHGPNNTRNQ